MSSTLQPAIVHGVWSFTPFTLDCARYLLRRNDEELDVDRACVEILATLLAHGGEVVTKDELLEAAWPGRVVSDNSLTKAIGRLRTVLDGHDLVATVHGYGYRFAGKARFQASAEAAPPASSANGTVKPGDAVPLRKGWIFDRQLGHGGYSEVWAARSADGQEMRAIKLATGESGLRALKREVALHRLIGADAGASVRVVGLLGWNLTQPPFFVEMPLIEAGNLRQWAERGDGLRAMPLAARLDFMARLAENVARVHAFGIIHKDLKPENILIALRDGTAEPLLSDFGASEVSGYGPMYKAFPFSSTLANALLDSPQVGSALYAAPEILRSETPTTRADIYALGILLYQMVVGDLRRPLAPGWELDVGDELLREDIHAAADSEPQRRLASADVLAERLHTLDRRRAELVERKEQRAEVLRNQQRAERAKARRRIGFVVGMTLLVGLLSTSFMYWHAKQARDQAVQEAQRSAAMLSFLTDDILSTGDPYGDHGNAMTVRDAVGKAAERLDYRYNADPQAKAAMHLAIAKVYQGLSDYDASVKHYDAAIDVAAHDEATRALLAPALTDLATAQIDADRLADADKTLMRATAITQSAQDPASASLRVLATQAQLYFEQGRYADAHAAAAQVIATGAAPDKSADDPLANAYWYAALSSQELADYRQSENEYRQLIALRETMLGAAHPYTAWAYSNYGGLLAEMGRVAEAEMMFEKAESMFIATLGADHPDTTSPRFRLAQLYLMQQRWADAVPLLESVLDIRRRKLGPEHAWTSSTALELADAYAWLGRPNDADRMMRLADPTGQRLGRDNDLDVTGLRTQTDIAYLRNAFDAALARNAELSQAIKSAHSEQHPRYAMTECMAARIFHAQNLRDQAQAHAENCGRLLAARLPATHPYRVQAQALLAEIGKR